MSEPKQPDFKPYYKAIDFWDSLFIDPTDDAAWMDGIEVGNGLIRYGDIYRSAMDQRIALWIAHPREDERLLEDLRALYRAVKRLEAGRNG